VRQRRPAGLVQHTRLDPSELRLPASPGRAGRLRTPFTCWLVRWPTPRERPGLTAFEDWLLAEAAATRQALG
jgi:hypothetical protein